MNAGELTTKLEYLFAGNLKLANDAGLTGHFISNPTKFIIKPVLLRGFSGRHKWTYGYMKASVYADGNNKMHVIAETKPIIVYPIIVTITILYVVVCLIKFFTETNGSGFMVAAMIVALVVLPMVVGIAKAMTVGVRQNVEVILGLTKTT